MSAKFLFTEDEIADTAWRQALDNNRDKFNAIVDCDALNRRSVFQTAYCLGVMHGIRLCAAKAVVPIGRDG
jgi:hypothetical protein